MQIRHTVIFKFYETTTEDQINDVISRLNDMGEYLQKEVGVTEWTVARHTSQTFKDGRAHLLQDGIFPDAESLDNHSKSSAHRRVVELTADVCDWMTLDTVVTENFS